MEHPHGLDAYYVEDPGARGLSDTALRAVCVPCIYRVDTPDTARHDPR